MAARKDALGLGALLAQRQAVEDTAKGAADGFKLTTFNARHETCAGTSTFREAFAKRRCIVPATAWFEWSGQGAPKPKFRFARADGGPIWFAGLWDRVTTPDAGEAASFTILTGPSAGVLADYHDRAPVILEDEDWSTWLDPNAGVVDLMTAVRPHRIHVAAA